MWKSTRIVFSAFSHIINSNDSVLNLTVLSLALYWYWYMHDTCIFRYYVHSIQHIAHVACTVSFWTSWMIYLGNRKCFPLNMFNHSVPYSLTLSVTRARWHLTEHLARWHLTGLQNTNCVLIGANVLYNNRIHVNTFYISIASALRTQWTKALKHVKYWHSTRGTRGLKSNRLNHANQLFCQIDLANRSNSYLASHDLRSSVKSD